jgi:hypothetical protein
MLQIGDEEKTMATAVYGTVSEFNGGKKSGTSMLNASGTTSLPMESRTHRRLLFF